MWEMNKQFTVHNGLRMSESGRTYPCSNAGCFWGPHGNRAGST
jgi:hypothetical protein